MKTLLQLAPVSAQTDADPGPDWRTQAACLDHNLEIFFPDPTDHDSEDEAIAICETCPVRTDCLTEAMDAETYLPASGRYGIWGGKTPQQRHAMYRRQGK